MNAEETAGAATLAELAAIGADVPYFASQLAAARVEGIGERVMATEPPHTQHVVLVHPPFTLPTAAVFAELRPGEWSGELRPGVNDLLAPARRLHPELDDVHRLVIAAGGDPHMTGSGPTIFSLTDDPERAAAVVARLQRAGMRASQTRMRRGPASIEAIDEFEE
jgi:4-diphosphocytidyl-2C-methyl-D-erythritol kinase